MPAKKVLAQHMQLLAGRHLRRLSRDSFFLDTARNLVN
jgi:hypothetical protein